MARASMTIVVAMLLMIACVQFQPAVAQCEEDPDIDLCSTDDDDDAKGGCDICSEDDCDICSDDDDGCDICSDDDDSDDVDSDDVGSDDVESDDEDVCDICADDQDVGCDICSDDVPSEPLKISTVEMEVALDPEEFDQESFLAAFAESSGVDASQVEAEVQFKIAVAYDFSASVTEAQATTVLASIHNVSELAVEVTISRRLQSGSMRRLQTTSVSATITSTDSTKAQSIKTANENATDAGAALSSALNQQFGIVATATQTSAPTSTVKVVTRITATQNDLDAIDTTAVQTSVNTATGGTVVISDPVVVAAPTAAPTVAPGTPTAAPTAITPTPTPVPPFEDVSSAGTATLQLAVAAAALASISM